MPRLPADPVGRLPVLEAARAGCKRGTVLNFADMAKVAGMTPRNLKIIIDADPKFPIKVRGDMGVPWEFNPRAVLNHLIKQAHAAKAQRERRMASVSRLAGLGAEAGAVSPGAEASSGSGSAAEMYADARALEKLIDVQVKLRIERERQKATVDVAAMERRVIEYNGVVQTAALSSAERADPTGAWPPEVRLAWEEACRNMLADIQNAANEWLATIRRAERG